MIFSITQYSGTNRFKSKTLNFSLQIHIDGVFLHFGGAPTSLYVPAVYACTDSVTGNMGPTVSKVLLSSRDTTRWFAITFQVGSDRNKAGLYLFNFACAS